MADIYDSEQEQIEALKRWWKENGTTVAIGLVLGLGGIFGWTSWQEHQIGQAEAASALFQRQWDAVAAENYPSADQTGTQLLEEFTSSGYAPMAALVLAKSAFEQGRLTDARHQLRWVLDSSARRELKLIARMRLARLLLDAQDPAGALALLDVADLGPFQPSFDELRADIHVTQRKPELASAAYVQALGRLDDPSAARRRVQMKLDDLGHTNIPTE